jgi:hypothetical protein
VTDKNALQDEIDRLIRETPGAKDPNDVLRIRGVEAFSPELLAKLSPIVHDHDGKTVPGPDHDEGRMVYRPHHNDDDGG